MPTSIYKYVEKLQRKIYRQLAWRKSCQIFKLVNDLAMKRKQVEESFM